MEHSKFKTVKEVRIAGILDELTVAFFKAECTYLNVTIYNWKKELLQFSPDILFVESAWRGEKSTWYRKVSPPAQELKTMIGWCKEQQITTVFWNKEDPVHFATFFETAMLFDWVFTTDLDCIPLYKRLLQHNQVGLLLFSACTKFFHPIEQFTRKKRICFAGSYYRKQEERTKDFESICEKIKDEIPMDIYARDSHPGNPDYTYPEKYKEQIIGTLPIEQMEYAYKQYYFNLTLNTVKYSSTMEARRVFELLASNTITISNPCQGVKNLLGDLVLYSTSEYDILGEIKELLNNQELYNKRRLLGLRKVLQEHTLYARMRYLLKKVKGIELQEEKKDIIIFSNVTSNMEMERVWKAYERQTYPNKKLVIVSTVLDLASNNSIIIDPSGIHKVEDLGVASFYSYFSPSHYYGGNYITDCMLAKTYCDSLVIGKGCYFTYSYKIYRKKNKKMRYCKTDQVMADRCIMDKKIAAELEYRMVIEKNSYISGNECMLIDEYNFCEKNHAVQCPIVDDIELNVGYAVQQIECIAENIQSSKYYTIQKELKPMEILGFIQSRKYPSIHIEGGETCVVIDSTEKSNHIQSIQCSEWYPISEYSIDGVVSTYFKGNIIGGAKLVIRFSDLGKRNKVEYKVQPNAYKKIKVPVWAQLFCVCIRLGNNESIQINEICFNAFPNTAIDLKQELRDGSSGWE